MLWDFIVKVPGFLCLPCGGSRLSNAIDGDPFVDSKPTFIRVDEIALLRSVSFALPLPSASSEPSLARSRDDIRCLIVLRGGEKVEIDQSIRKVALTIADASATAVFEKGFR